MLIRHFSAMTHIISLAITTTIVSGCIDAQVKKKLIDENIQRDESVPSTTLRWLPIEDPACIASGTSASVSEVTIYQWNGTSTSAKKVAFNGRSGDAKSFASENVIGSLIDFEMNYNCNSTDTGTDCKKDDTTPSTSSHEFKMCRANGTYGRDSLESMTLTSQYFTEAAYLFFGSIPGHKTGLVKSVLIPQPLVKRHTTDKSGTVTDNIDVNNASFSSLPATESDGKLGLFFVFPTSIKSFERTGLNLWEVSFVMSHEFGHHVLGHYLNETLSTTALRLTRSNDVDAILPDPSRKHRPVGSLDLTDKLTQAQQALDGINETFADLFAYFAGNGIKNQLKGVRCLELTRDPSSELTLKGSSKGLDLARVDIFEGRKPALPYAECEPQFDDEHDIATALGQPIANFIEASTPNLNSKARAQILLTWASKLNVTVSTPSSVSLDSLVVDLVRSVKEVSPNITGSCQTFKTKITGLKAATAACTN
jgi:hypothetical protein